MVVHGESGVVDVRLRFLGDRRWHDLAIEFERRGGPRWPPLAQRILPPRVALGHHSSRPGYVFRIDRISVPLALLVVKSVLVALGPSG